MPFLPSTKELSSTPGITLAAIKYAQWITLRFEYFNSWGTAPGLNRRPCEPQGSCLCR